MKDPLDGLSVSFKWNALQQEFCNEKKTHAHKLDADVFIGIFILLFKCLLK